jgi:hypothetical protein
MDKNSQSRNLWRQVEIELMTARLARKNGNEGKARVCARRAVSQALFLSGFSSTHALAAIQSFVENTSIPDEIRLLGYAFLEKVDETYKLPSGIDLIENAQQIINFIQNRSK